MTRRVGPQLLPAAVILPAAPLIGAAHLRMVLGVSKAVIWLWRTRQGFPQGHRDGSDVWTLTAAVATWLEARGTRVRVTIL